MSEEEWECPINDPDCSQGRCPTMWHHNHSCKYSNTTEENCPICNYKEPGGRMMKEIYLTIWNKGGSGEFTQWSEERPRGRLDAIKYIREDLSEIKAKDELIAKQQRVINASKEDWWLRSVAIEAYECGHNDTVESNYGDAEERVDEIIDEALEQLQEQ